MWGMLVFFEKTACLLHMKDRNPPELYLASQSPQRQRLLSAICSDFELLDLEVDETPLMPEPAREYVLRLANAKAGAGFRRAAGNVRDFDGRTACCVVGSDTCVVIDETKLGKPVDDENAFAMLRLLRGRTHQVYSAVAVHCDLNAVSMAVAAEVEFSPITDRQISEFIAAGESKGRAGAYGIQGQAKEFITRLRGSWSCVVGLPVLETAKCLQMCGVKVNSYQQSVAEILRDFGTLEAFDGQIRV